MPGLCCRVKLQKLVKVTTDQVLHQNSTISELKKHVEAARRDSHTAASQHSAGQLAAADRLRQLGQVRAHLAAACLPASMCMR